MSCTQPSPNTYCYNARSRLTDDGFSSWLRAFDRDRRRLGRRAALLVPGDARPFSARRQQRLHRGLTNTTVFTLPSTNSVVGSNGVKRRGKKAKKSSDAHPLKSGVVEDFKTRYRIQVLRRCPASPLAPIEASSFAMGGVHMLNLPTSSMTSQTSGAHYNSRSPLHNDATMHSVTQQQQQGLPQQHINLSHPSNTAALINAGLPVHDNTTPNATNSNTNSSPINPSLSLTSSALSLNPTTFSNHQTPQVAIVAPETAFIDVMAARECATIAWNSVRKDTVKMAFARCGFAPANNGAGGEPEKEEVQQGIRYGGAIAELTLLMDAFNKSTGRHVDTAVAAAGAGGASATSCRAYINADDYLSAYSDTEDEREAEERQLEEEEERMFADEAKLDIKLEQFDADLTRDPYASLPIFPEPHQRSGNSPPIHADDDVNDPLHRITLMPVGNMSHFPSQSSGHGTTLDDLSPDDPLLPIAMLPLESLDQRSSRQSIGGAASGSRDTSVTGPYPKQMGGQGVLGMSGAQGGGYTDAMRHLAYVRDYFASDATTGGNAIYEKLDDIKTSIESIRHTRITRPPGD